MSSFGIGGTNVHAVLMSAPDTPEARNAPASGPGDNEHPTGSRVPLPLDRPAVLTFSAKSREALRDYAAALEAGLDRQPEIDLASLCRCSNLHRSHLSVRAATTVVTAERLRKSLRTFEETDRATGGLVVATAARKPPRIAFVFTGQGSHYTGMGQALYRQEPGFRAAIDNMAVSFEEHTGGSLHQVLFDCGRLQERARFVQPALYCIGCALAQLWVSWGVRPSVALGHSLGEYAAATLAGRLTFDEGLALVAKRGALMDQLEGRGGMLVVFAEADKVASLLRSVASDVVVSADNAPAICTISGSVSALDQIRPHLAHAGYETRPLAVSHAFHSPQMNAMLVSFEAFIRSRGVPSDGVPSEPIPTARDVQLISSVSGSSISETTALDGAYWAEQLRKPVRFRQCVEEARLLDCDVFLEIGPERVLSPLVEATLGASGCNAVASLCSRDNGTETICDAVAQLHCLGVTIDFGVFSKASGNGKMAPRVELPKYPFQRKSYWLDVSSDNRRPAWTYARKGSDEETVSALSAERDRPRRSSASRPQASAGDTRDIVLAAVAKVCGADVSSIPQESLLVEELGFSSLMVADLVAALEADVPAIRSIPMGFFFNGASVADLLALFRDQADDDVPNPATAVAHALETDSESIKEAIAQCEAWSAESRPGVVTRIPARWVHQHHDRNVLLARQALLAPGMVIGEATQDLTHPFFYDHRQDHVPGLYIIESVRQLITASAHMYFGVPEKSRFVLTDLNIRFDRFADNDRAYFMILDNGKSMFERDVMTYIDSVTHIVQSASVIGTVRGQGRVMNPHEYEGSRDASRIETTETTPPTARSESEVVA